MRSPLVLASVLCLAVAPRAHAQERTARISEGAQIRVTPTSLPAGSARDETAGRLRRLRFDRCVPLEDHTRSAFDLTVGPDGRVQRYTPTGAAVGESDVARCLEGVLRQAQLPPAGAAHSLAVELQNTAYRLGARGPDGDVGDVLAGNPRLDALPDGITTSGRARPRPQPRSLRVRLRWTAMRVRGELDQRQVRRILRRRTTLFHRCYERELRRRPGLLGRIVLELDVASNGRVRATALGARSDSLAEGPVGVCVRRVAMHLRFPAPADGRDAQVTFGLVFDPQPR